jgi:hypothetical protein
LPFTSAFGREYHPFPSATSKTSFRERHQEQEGKIVSAKRQQEAIERRAPRGGKRMDNAQGVGVKYNDAVLACV